MSQRSKILVYGYGNPGRMDDGLGPAFAATFEKKKIEGLTVDSNYQLSVEDADAVAKHDLVILVDAHVSCQEPFELTGVEPIANVSFSSHSLSPQALAALAQDLFGSQAPVFLLAIRGYEFNEFRETLSEGAAKNLAAAIEFVERGLQSDNLAIYLSAECQKQAE